MRPHGHDDTERRRPVIVQKYGGSSVADTDKLGRVADRVVATQRAGYGVVAVVSAMGKTTDQLLALAGTVAGAGAVPGGQAPRRELDMLVSTGERVSMALLSIAIQARGEDAISFTGSQCGIITNDRHFDARIIEVRPHRIEDELARGRVVIVAGYQGMSYRREITTLGRGGSDTTAVALAAALAAERCEIYSDVDGIYSADPRVVPDAQHLPELDHATLQQMAECGAKVLCAQAVELARRSGIALYARSTFDDGASRQTIVRKDVARQETCARAVACDVKLAMVSIAGDARLLGRVLELLERSELRVAELAHTGERTVALISLVSAPQWPGAKRALMALDGVDVDDAVASVSIVGSGIGDRPEHLLFVRRTLSELGIEPLVVLASALRITAMVPATHAEDTQRALHSAFVIQPLQSPC